MGSWGKRGDVLVHEEMPFNAEPPASSLAGRALTDVDTFFLRNHGEIPQIDHEQWSLRVDGLVGSELVLSLADLRDFEQYDVVATVQCAGNRRTGLNELEPIVGETPWGSGATSTARWSGARLVDVLEAAGVAPEAAHVEFEGPDLALDASPPQPFGASIPIRKACCAEVLLAWEMNDEPLPPAHGGPVRVVVPGFIGARSVKWVRRVTARATPSENYFQAVAYRLLPDGADLATAPPELGQLGPVPVMADVLSPEDGAIVPAGPTEVSGYAFAGEARIASVEVSVDDGRSWLPVALAPQPSPWQWRQWTATVDLPAGENAILARAADTEGRTQPECVEEVWNAKGYANNARPRVRVTAKP